MKRIRSAATYVFSTFAALRVRPDLTTLGYAIRYALPCLRLFHSSRPDFLSLRMPWLCFPAAEHLERLVRPDHRVFEYGSGGSTLYLAERVAALHSVEHEPAWHDRVHSALARMGYANVDHELREPTAAQTFDASRIADPLAYVSSDSRAEGKTFEDYAGAIDRFPDGHFDLVIVDGRVRPSCLVHAMPKVRTGGVLMLDQSERPHYLQRVPCLRDKTRWSVVRYMAPLPYSLHFTEASFFTKLPPC